ncbi:hypothetical protein MRX96_033475 [Rhipicephalus microplus]
MIARSLPYWPYGTPPSLGLENGRLSNQAVIVGNGDLVLCAAVADSLTATITASSGTAAVEEAPSSFSTSVETATLSIT